ncbi:MAG: BlaB/IND/MUS family subclass B1 metallo-beta-lactamase [Ferruginibacter sp.]
MRSIQRKILMTNLSLLFLLNSFSQNTDSNLKITQLTGDFYIFTTYNLYKGMRIPANGMYLVTSQGVAMFDSPWDSTQFQPLLDSIKLKHNKKVVLCIATHFHEDRTGGLEYYRLQGIQTFTTKRTDLLSKEKGMKRAEYLLDQDSLFKLGQYSFQTYYPGPGHAPDNIVIWFEKEKILYGGCLIKSTEADDLGNLGDANQIEYAGSVENVIRKCVDPKFVIPGHDDWTSIASLKHTLKMAQQLKKKSSGKTSNRD